MIRPASETSSQHNHGSQSRIARARIRNYKSIEKACIELGPLTVLVGRNGAGKSNCIDALAFAAESLRTHIQHAISARGGLDGIRRRSTGHPRDFALELDLILPDDRTATYGFEIAARKKGGFVVKREGLVIRESHSGSVAHYEVREGVVESKTAASMPVAAPDRLYLVSASNLPEFRPVYDCLSAMGFYNLQPDSMRDIQVLDSGEQLRHDGGNLASVLMRLKSENGEGFERLTRYLQAIVPGLSRLDAGRLGRANFVQFFQTLEGTELAWSFHATNMSDGTLRALGILVAIVQLVDRNIHMTLVGIEEPENALHPAAVEALVDALHEAAIHTQILITTHSPDLLDHIDPDKDTLNVVLLQNGSSQIASIDSAGRTAIKEHLFSAGELLRMDQLEPDPESIRKQSQLTFLFGAGEDEE